MVVGLGVLNEMVDDAERRRTAIAARLPDDAPDDMIAVGFAALFDEYERKLREIAGRRLASSSGSRLASSYSTRLVVL